MNMNAEIIKMLTIAKGMVELDDLERLRMPEGERRSYETVDEIVQSSLRQRFGDEVTLTMLLGMIDMLSFMIAGHRESAPADDAIFVGCMQYFMSAARPFLKLIPSEDDTFMDSDFKIK